MPRLSSLVFCVMASCALAQGAQGITVKQNSVMLTYAPETGFVVRVQSRLAADFPKGERVVQANVSCDSIRVSNLTRADDDDVAAWRKRFVQDNMIVLGSTRLSCQDGRLVVRAGNRAALLQRFPNYASSYTPEQRAELEALDRYPALTLYRDGVEFLGFRFLFTGGKVTADSPEGQMAVSQGGKPRPVLFDGKLTPVPLNNQRPYTLHTSVPGSKVWSNLRVDSVTGTVTIWSSETPQP